MDMNSMDMGPTATDGASMPMPTSPSDTMMAGMGPMPMVFVTSTTSSLWSSSFTPSTIGQYAGICIFLIVFATVFRFLIAFRVNFFDIMAAAEQRRNGGLLYPYATEGKSIARPWRAREAVMMGFMDVTIAGVSYLLMLAVMTMNVGYFLSILAGVFIGSIVCGRFIGSSAVH
ncbi:hypothetical protein V495_04154 [Pseudogymnoascus sp. VKM F-4514 (FW-929)]|nr:hypothetical protein V495_04154 [Pseudogymnoascus sp. VKM F-4514 (FW-929)]KFY60217.1 hypothetical protein V497_03789 [Pseudogymnoascus sp. VKM F-4516 (FW-969)]